MDGILKENQIKTDDFQYISVSRIKYPVVIKQSLYNPMDFVSSIMINKTLALAKKKSGVKDKDSKSKKCKKQKNKIDQQPQLTLSKQDTKMGIYAIKTSKEDKGKKQKPKISQQIQQQQQKIIKQVETLALAQAQNQTKTTDEQHQQSQQLQKNKKGKKNKTHLIKKDKGLNEEEMLSSNVGNDQNKQVDDLIKQIKNKKENIEKTKKNETIKTKFINSYKYLFTLDPAQRLKLRDQSLTSFPTELYSLFKLLGKESIEGDKEQIKDSVIIIDNLIEISCSIKDIPFLNSMIHNIVQYYNDYLVNKATFSEQQLSFLFNTLYSLIKLKVEMNIKELFNKEQFVPLENVLIALAKNAIEALANDNKLVKQNDKLMNSIIPYLLMQIIFIDDSNPIEQPDTVLSLLIARVSKMTIDQDTKDNFDNYKMHYDNMNLFNKLNLLFDVRKEMIYSLNMKTSKYIEAALNQMQIKLLNVHKEHYSVLIEDLLVCYLNNFDLFYVIDYKFYDDMFALLMMYCDKFSSVINYQRIFKDFAFQTYSFEYDDSLIKFILFIMKFIKLFNGLLASPNPNEEHLGYYVSFFNKILDFILDTNQSYLREKYTALLHREIDEPIKIKYISLTIFNYIQSSIEAMIVNENNMSKLMKNVKELTKFYKKYSPIKEHIISYLNSNEAKNSIKGQICSLFFYNFFSVANKNDLNLLQHNIDYQSILHIDEEAISFLMNYYIEEELNNLSQIENALYNESKVYEIINNILLDAIKGLHPDVKKIHFALKLSKKTAKQFNIKELIQEKNEMNKKIIDSLAIYYINSNWTDIDWNEYYKWKGEEVVEEIKDVNNQTKSYKSNYFDTNESQFYDQLIAFLLQIRKLQIILAENPLYYKSDDIVIEDEPIERDKKYPVNPNQKTDNDSKSESEPKEGTQMKQKPIIDDKPKETINFDIILIAFNEIFNHPLFDIQNNYSQENLFLFNQIQQFVQKVLSNELIYSNLKRNKPLLISFLKRFIGFQSHLSVLKDQLTISLKQLVSISNAEEITQKLTQMAILSQCELNITELISNRCCEQLSYLYPEEDIYNLLFSKDRRFLLNVTNNLNQVYKYQILNQQKIDSLLNKAQNEEEDLLENVIYEIFGKKVIEYLEYPEELIDFLTKMNEGLKYNLTLTKKKLYEAIFPFFYLWKNIMGKLENGFRLYTSDKQHVTVIENYKTLLKFTVNYLERNSKLYEMYLLIMVSLLHLIDELQDDSIFSNDSSSFETFKDEDLTDNFDNNTYQFLLANLFKFVKIFPSLVKFYYDESKNKLKNVFKKLISSMILPKLLRDLHERIKSNEKILKENKIILADSISFYFIQFYFTVNDEIKFQIEIKVPPIFPLKKIDINIKCNATIDERKMLNISMNLNHTLNSSIDNISDNLIIWTEDAKQLIIKGHEPCPICYFYLHTTDKSLPGIYCHVCKKKFHGLCVKEWFKNLRQKGQNPSCPMCRSEWKKKI